jgi:hypothetical protein
MEIETVSEEDNDSPERGRGAQPPEPSGAVPESRMMSQVDIALVRTLRDVLGELLIEQRALVGQLIEQQTKTTPAPTAPTPTAPPITKEAAEAIDRYRRLQRQLGRK